MVHWPRTSTRSKAFSPLATITRVSVIATSNSHGYGFTKTALPVLQSPAAFAWDHLAQSGTGPTVSARKVVTLKGYQHWAGRALVGLRALEQCAEQD
jgi:hypothetical protein